MLKVPVLLAGAALAFSGAPAQAAVNLAVNGSFETGDFTGWTAFGDTSYTGVGDIFADGTEPLDGDYQAFFGPLAPGGIQQDIATVAGRFYRVSFGFSSRGGGPASLSAAFGGSIGYAFADCCAGAPVGYGVHQFTVQALGDMTSLDFTFTDQPSFLLLDKVEVSEVAGPGGVPEPAAWSLMILGFAAAGVALRRRAQVRA